MITLVEPGTPKFYEIESSLMSTLERLFYKTETDWDLPDVINDLNTQDAAFFLVEGVGFFIVRDIGKALDIWIGAAFDGKTDMLGLYFDELMKLAKQIGFKSLRFTSARKGWKKVAPKNGFKPVSVSITYEYRG